MWTTDCSAAGNHRFHSIRQPVAVLQKLEFFRLRKLPSVSGAGAARSVADRVRPGVVRRAGVDGGGQRQRPHHGVVQPAVRAGAAARRVRVAAGPGGSLMRAALHVLPERRPAVAVRVVHRLARRAARDDVHQHRRAVPQSTTGDRRAPLSSAEALGLPCRRHESNDDAVAHRDRPIWTAWPRRT